MTKREKKIITKAEWVDRTMIRSHHKIGICTSEEDFWFEMERLGIPKKDWGEWLSGDADAVMHKFEGTNKDAQEKIAIICIEPNLKTAVSFLIHEAVHIYQEEMELIQEHNPSDEFMAYSIQEIATNLINGYLAKPKKGKNIGGIK